PANAPSEPPLDETVDVKAAYSAYETGLRPVRELETLLAATLKDYQPTSRKVAEIQERLRRARDELRKLEGLKHRADVAVCRALPAQIRAKQNAYDEMVKELRPTAPEPIALAKEIQGLDAKLRAFPVDVQFEARHGPLREADADSWLSLAEVAVEEIKEPF